MELPGGYLLTALGICDYYDRGNRLPLSWAEIHAFSRCCPLRLSDDFEREALRVLSTAYLEGLIEGEDPFSIMPSAREAQ